MENIKVALISRHLQNTLYFNDLSGQKWEEFLESVKTSGVIEPIVVTQDFVIVAGHQRVRACIELGITEVPCIVRQYDDDIKVLKDLIETNIRQRGSIDCSAMQWNRIILVLEQFYNIKLGGNRGNQYISAPHYPMDSQTKTQEDLAAELGIDISVYRRYKKMSALIPEIQEMMESENISASVASRLIARLSQEEQKQLAEMLPIGEKITTKVAEHYIEQLSQREVEFEQQLRESERRIEKQVQRADEMEAKIFEVTNLDLIKEIEEAKAKERTMYEKMTEAKKQLEQQQRLTLAQKEKVLQTTGYVEGLQEQVETLNAQLSSVLMAQKMI